MTYPTRSLCLRNMLVPGLLALLLALLMIAFGPSVVSAQDVGPGPPPPDIPGPGGPMTGPDDPGPPAGPTDDPNPGGTNGGNGSDGMMMMKPSPLPSNRIVMHAATPVQLVKTGDGGLHLYFIGADGSTYTGPVLSSFAALEEMYPSGAAVSLYDGKNPSTGKPVTVDYLPDENRIFVKTFYPAGHDKYNPNKAYDFTVDADYVVKHANW